MLTSFDATAATALITSFLGVLNDYAGVLLIGASVSLTIIFGRKAVGYVRRLLRGRA